jgi:Membrane bound FAD containing D-sorbitol dehydrogenase
MLDGKAREFITLLGAAETPSRPRALSRAAAHTAAGSLHRRELLQRLLAAGVATATCWRDDALAAALPLERDRFIEVSEKLCAMSIDDGSLADTIQKALREQYPADQFTRINDLLQSAAAGDVERLIVLSRLHELAKSIVSVWYSGLIGTGERTRVLAYEEALAWRATAYAKAPGTCGEFADWTREPPDTLDRESRP